MISLDAQLSIVIAGAHTHLCSVPSSNAFSYFVLSQVSCRKTKKIEKQQQKQENSSIEEVYIDEAITLAHRYIYLAGNIIIEGRKKWKKDCPI